MLTNLLPFLSLIVAVWKRGWINKKQQRGFKLIASTLLPAVVRFVTLSLAARQRPVTYCARGQVMKNLQKIAGAVSGLFIRYRTIAIYKAFQCRDMN